VVFVGVFMISFFPVFVLLYCHFHNAISKIGWYRVVFVGIFLIISQL